jgi:hypothetical protein
MLFMTMNEIQEALKIRYPHIHPLLFHRCVEKAKTNGDLFDMLEKMPELPMVWNDEAHAWQTTDLLQTPGKS